MDLDGIRLLIRVVEAGSVQRAAQLLGVSRGSLRRSLESLEAEVGRELYVRGATRLSLTPAGSVVVEEGRALLEACARMVSSAKATSGEAVGRVLVVVPLGLPETMRIWVIRALNALAPGVCVEEVERAEPLDHVHEPFDLLFHFGAPPERGQWFSRVAARVRLVPLASRAYLDEMGVPASPADLARHRLLSWRVAGLEPREWPLVAGGTLAIEPLFCSRSGQMLHRAAQEGLGILLGNPDANLLPLETPLVPVLDRAIARELTLRCLSPLPGDVDPRIRAVLASIQSFLAAHSEVEPR